MMVEKNKDGWRKIKMAGEKSRWLKKNKDGWRKNKNGWKKIKMAGEKQRWLEKTMMTGKRYGGIYMGIKQQW